MTQEAEHRRYGPGGRNNALPERVGCRWPLPLVLYYLLMKDQAKHGFWDGADAGEDQSCIAVRFLFRIVLVVIISKNQALPGQMALMCSGDFCRFAAAFGYGPEITSC